MLGFFILLILDLFFRSFILLTSLDYKGYLVHYSATCWWVALRRDKLDTELFLSLLGLGSCIGVF